MENVIGMRGTDSYTQERKMDYGEKIKSLAKKKKKPLADFFNMKKQWKTK